MLFVVAKGLQAVGIADVAYGLYLGVFQDDMWGELWLSLVGLALFGVGRLLERRT
ncbi:MAG TPA: hypothetical protein VNO26_17135 [Candidatus Limnocylindria bacterium]|nr:hypothetical protein [Candidatus Limnocylindria bacterium]